LRLIGRDSEVEALAEVVSTTPGSGSAMLFVGEPGVGKTALLNVAAVEAADAGRFVVRVTGAEFEAEIGYSALMQAVLPLTPFVDRLAPFQRTALLIATGGAEGEPPERLVVAAAALRLLQLASEERPVLLIVDDLQWVDQASAEVFFFVARRVHGSRLCFLAAARSGSSILLGHVNLDERELAPLDDKASDDLLRERFPTLSGSVRQRLLTEAQGNPLALLELPPALSARARTAREAMPAALPLTRRLQSVFAARIEALPAPTRDELLLASLDAVGDSDVIRRAADDPSLTQLLPAEEAGLVALTDHLEFRHPLTRSAVVGLATGVQVRDAHRRLGEALAADPDRQAWHLGEATIGPDERVAELVERAARRAVARGDRKATARLLKAADLSPDLRERNRRVTEAAYLGAFGSVTAGGASRLVEQARRLPPSSDEALYAAAGAAYVTVSGEGDVRAAFRVLRDAIDAVEPSEVLGSPALLAVLEISAGLCQLLGSTEYADEFGRLLDHLGPAAPERFRLWVAAVLDPARTVLDAIDRIDAALATIDDVADADVLGLGATAIYTDRLAPVRKALERIVANVGDVDLPYAQAARILLWLADFFAGNWDDADATAQAAPRLSDLGTMWKPYLAYLIGWMAAARGDDAGVAGSVDRLLATAEAHDARLWRLYARHVLTASAAGRGDFDAVYRHASAISPAGALAEQTPTALWVFFDLVEAAVHTGRVAEARRHVAAARELRIDRISDRLAMWVTAAQALVAGTEGGANDLFRRALGRPAIHQWPFDVARLRLSYGEYLRREHAVVEARHQLDLARDTFDRLRAQPWVNRVETQIQKLTEKPGSTVETAGLTAKEYEVAQLAARGLTNKQIGAELFLSPRTVGTYLYRAYPKLGVSTRAALRDALTRHQPVDHS
jgi:DNA-binding CsgD family transcriptional regulator